MNDTTKKDYILRFQDVRIDYRTPEGLVKSVDGVTFDVERGKITAIIGESGSGKSTLGGAILKITASNGKIHPESRILFNSQDILKMNPEQVRDFRWRRASMVFQAAQSALNPVLRIHEQLIDSITDHGEDPHSKKYSQRIDKLLNMVQLDPRRVKRAYPHQLSGGMRQRVIIAMAMVLEPEFVVLDEPTTALDVITQSYIFKILKDVHKTTRTTMLFITHDMNAVSALADNVGVMYGGKILELANRKRLFGAPRHPYTVGLLNSIPSIRGDTIERKAIPGQPPDLINKPAGCVFHPRCEYALDSCREKEPPLSPKEEGHFIACHRASELFPENCGDDKSCAS